MTKAEFFHPPLPFRLETYLIQSKRNPKLFVLHRRDPLHEAEVCAAIEARKTSTRLLSAHRQRIINRNLQRIS